MTVVHINHGNIRSFFERQSLAGASIPGANRRAEVLSRAMVRQAEANARADVTERTGELFASFIPIVRRSPRTGGLEIGVATTVEHGKFLEEGTPAHTIFRGFGRSNIPHPGNREYRFMRRAVNQVIGRGV